MSTEPLENTLAFFEERAHYLLRWLPQLCSLKNGLYNINIPGKAVRGLRWAHLAKRLYASKVDVRNSPRGKTYCWIGGPPTGYQGTKDSDVPLFQEGFATITPLTLLGTDPSLVRLKDQFADFPTEKS